MRRLILIAAAACLLQALTACSPPQPVSISASPTPSVSLPPFPDDTAPPSVPALTSMVCDYNSLTLYTLEQAWGVQKARGEKWQECEVEIDPAGTLSTAETAALAAAPSDDELTYTLADMYSLCAGLDDYAATTKDLAESQVEETEAMLILCPDKPGAKKMRKNIAASSGIRAARAGGTRFFDGTYRVGKQVKVGTYAIKETADNCYWARLDSSGNILDNALVPEGTRAQVTIREADYSFSADGCGEWIRQ